VEAAFHEMILKITTARPYSDCQTLLELVSKTSGTGIISLGPMRNNL